MTRRRMNVKQKVKVFVEGDTEKNYIEGLRKNTEIDFSIETVNMKGGGYRNFINEIRKVSTSGFLIFIIIIDLDKAIKDGKDLDELVKLCEQKTKLTQVPHLIIGNNEDFEVVSCAHCPNYKGEDTTAYIKKTYGYKDLEDYKKDKKVYEVLNQNSKGRGFKLAIKYFEQKYKTGQVYLKYDLDRKLKGLDIDIKIKNININKLSLNSKHSNIFELFHILGLD